MLSFGNKEFRNLQEQVLKNAQDIETLKGRDSLQIVIVEELPEEGNPNYIYLVPNDDEEESNVYNEYIWLADSEEYEKIGGVNIDLTNYVTLDSEQTITGAKTFSEPSKLDSIVTPSDKNFIIYRNDGTTPAFIFGNYDGTSKSNYSIVPTSNNTLNLGSASLNWKDLYLIGKICTYDPSYPATNYWHIFATNQFNLMLAKNGVNRFMFQQNQFSPTDYQNAQCNLGSANYAWKDLYLTGNISDGLNTVSVANIASKVTSAYASGTFDTNGEDTIDISGGTPEGFFIFDCGNCQTMLHLTATMVQNAELTPIYIPAMYIYNGSPAAGWLKISKSGNTLTLLLSGGLTHVDSGYAWTLTKTNLL